MNKIYLNKEKYGTLYDFGGESKIYLYNNNELFKCFKPKITDYQRQNKIKKLEIIENIPLDYIIKANNVVTNNNKIIGYTMSYDSNSLTLDEIRLSIEEKLNILKLIKKYILEMYKYNILYCDLKTSNILINNQNKKIKFCDMDGIQVENYKNDINPLFLNRYIETIGKLDNNALSYLHNLLTLELLYEDCYSYDQALCFIKDNNYPSILNEESKEIAKQLLYLNKNYEGKYIIDRLV